MEGFEQKSLKTSRGYKYTYYLSPAQSAEHASLPTLLFSHGWPDHAQMFEQVVKHLRANNVPNAILIPDQLGYDGTDKPTDPSAYQFSRMTQDVVEILDTENIPTVISIGHDWGSRMAQRMYHFHPTRVVGLVMLNVAYGPPTRQPFSLDETNALTEKAFGYPIFMYWHLFAAPDGPRILQDNVEQLFDILHIKQSDGMKRFFCQRDTMRNHLLSDPSEVEAIEVRDYAKDPAFKAAFVDRMRRDGFAGAQNWYVATTTNEQYECEKDLPADRDQVNIPALYIGCTEDAVCRPEMMIPAKQAGLLPDLEESRMIEAAHWAAFEKPAEIAEILAEWVLRRFPV